MMKIFKIVSISFLVLLIFAYIIYLPFIYNGTNKSDLLTWASGIMSAVATASLGGIAVWQNYMYKRMADNTNDLILMPEFYLCATTNEKRGRSGLQSSISFTAQTDQPLTSYYFGLFGILKPPIINIQPVVLVYGKNMKCKFEPLNKTYSFHDEKDSFDLSIKLPEPIGCNQYELTLKYENIYGTEYIKIIRFSLNMETEKKILNNLELSRSKRSNK